MISWFLLVEQIALHLAGNANGAQVNCPLIDEKIWLIYDTSSTLVVPRSTSAAVAVVHQVPWFLFQVRYDRFSLWEGSTQKSDHTGVYKATDPGILISKPFHLWWWKCCVTWVFRHLLSRTWYFHRLQIASVSVCSLHLKRTLIPP